MKLMRSKPFPFYVWIILALGAGAATGSVIGPRALMLGEFGLTLITALKWLAIPLLFFAVLETVLVFSIAMRDFGRLLFLSFANATVALILGLGLSSLIKPGLTLRRALVGVKPMKAEFISGHENVFHFVLTNLPRTVLNPFGKGQSVLGIVFYALVLGLVLRKIPTLRTRASQFSLSCLKICERVIHFVIYLVPFAVFCVVAKVVHQYGFKGLPSLSLYILTALLGLTLHVALTYQFVLRFVAKQSLSKFWKAAQEPLSYALGSGSSMATLPLTLKALERLKISDKSARLACCVGNNFNHDGILLYEAMAVICIAQLHGIELSLAQKILAAAACALAGIGIAGIPEAGLVSLALVLGTLGLPLEWLPLLLTVDWIIGRARAMTNVLNEMTVAVTLDSFKTRLNR